MSPRANIVENMQNDSSWSLYGTNPSSFKITIDHTVVYNENIASINIDNITETHVTKFRGIYEDAVISKVYEDVEVYEDENDEPVVQSRHLGLYKIEFPQFSMVQHSQNLLEQNFVEFYNGSVRIHTVTYPNGKRKILKVVKTANIGAAGQTLIIYANDATFPVNENELIDYEGKIIADGQDSTSQKVNYYPGYKVYLYQNVSQGITEPNILPGEDEDLRYSIFSLRSRDTTYDFRSRLSTPALMYAKSIKEPLIPEKPEGGLFATRPDFFGKATYTFTTKFKQKPYSVQFGRASDIQLLSSLYDHSNNYHGSGLSTVEYILEKIFKDGREESYMD